jgi:hypothetical protein
MHLPLAPPSSKTKVKTSPRSGAWLKTVPALFLAGWLWICTTTPAQQPQQPVAPVSPEKPDAPTQKSQASGESSSSKKHKSIPPFVILGTVFDTKALAFPGVEVRVRLKGEKKFRWDTYTNSRGEFAVRVPEGPDYEVFVHAKHFQDVTRVVSARGGELQQGLSIRMEPTAADKSGEKK